jgi:hypothetical protein
MSDYVPTTAEDLAVDDDPVLVTDDPEVPDADRWEQLLPPHGGVGLGQLSLDPEVPEADALEQAAELPGFDADEFDDR